ncbi:class I SAM-dependent methyltransferase [Maridesulfovibrio bastinii]|uniref:class I SAM-dependent methyltransferase n=1 Tax=Maridesulfovibrio bastinii TaxID=47157 RepID=UPI00041312D8|nr:methyltransferase domain-containing protein [Maridesulfovibrio bastinii]
MTFDPLQGSIEVLAVEVAGVSWKLERTSDLETLWNEIGENDFGEDERLPYWAELWPASVLLGEWLVARAEDLKGSKCLDLGCGLGLTAVIASGLGADVVAFDYEFAPLHFARRNAFKNNVPQPLWMQMDWREHALKPGSVDFIWGGDILYEKRFFDPLERLFRHALKPGGKIWMAEPRRDVSASVWGRLESLGWNTALPLTAKAACCGAEMTVNIREVTKD